MQVSTFAPRGIVCASIHCTVSHTYAALFGKFGTSIETTSLHIGTVPYAQTTLLDMARAPFEAAGLYLRTVPYAYAPLSGVIRASLETASLDFDRSAMSHADAAIHDNVRASLGAANPLFSDVYFVGICMRNLSSVSDADTSLSGDVGASVMRTSFHDSSVFHTYAALFGNCGASLHTAGPDLRTVPYAETGLLDEIRTSLEAAGLDLRSVSHAESARLDVGGAPVDAADLYPPAVFHAETPPRGIGCAPVDAACQPAPRSFLDNVFAPFDTAFLGLSLSTIAAADALFSFSGRCFFRAFLNTNGIFLDLRSVSNADTTLLGMIRASIEAADPDFRAVSDADAPIYHVVRASIETALLSRPDLRSVTNADTPLLSIFLTSIKTANDYPRAVP